MMEKSKQNNYQPLVPRTIQFPPIVYQLYDSIRPVKIKNRARFKMS